MMVTLLGVSIGAASTIAVVYDAAVLHPIPGSEPDKILALGGLATGGGIDDPVGWWQQAPALDRLTLYTVGDVQYGAPSVDGGWARVAEVSGSFFELFRVSAVRGRLPTRGDERTDQHVAVVQETVWRQIGGDRPRSDRLEVRLNGVAYGVIGAVPDWFGFPSDTKLWVPRTLTEGLRVSLVDGVSGLPPIRSRSGWLARIKGDTTPVQLQQQMLALLANANATLTPKTGVRYGEIVGVRSLLDSLTRDIRPPMMTLLVATLTILLLAMCSLMVYAITRGIERRREFAIKQSLGASARVILGEFGVDACLTIGLCLSVSVLTEWRATALAQTFLRAFRIYVPSFSAMLPYTMCVSLIGIGIVTIVSSVPSWLAYRATSAVEVLGGGLSDRSTGRGVFLRRSFVVLTSSLSTILLAGAVTADSALVRLRSVPLGHASGSVVAARLLVERDQLGGPAFGAKRQDLLSALRTTGAKAAMTSVVTTVGSQRSFVFLQAAPPPRRLMAHLVSVDGEYFEVMKIPVIAGDPAKLREVDGLVVNQSLATALGPRESWLGQLVSFDGSLQPAQVVAVVGDTRTIDQGAKTVYEAYRIFPAIDATVSPKSTVAIEALTQCPVDCQSELRRVASALHGVAEVRLVQIDTIASRIAAAGSGTTVAAGIWSIYGSLALLVAVASCVTLVAHNLARRRFEIGIRAALGASPKRLVGTVIVDGITSVALGAVLGGVIARGAGRTLAAASGPAAVPDVPALILVVTLIVVVGFAAAAITGRRAAMQQVAVLLTPDREPR